MCALSVRCSLCLRLQGLYKTWQPSGNRRNLARAAYLIRSSMRAASVLVALAALGPRASAQPNQPVSRTPASPIRLAPNAAKADVGRSAWDILSWASLPHPKRELMHEMGSGATTPMPLQSEQGSGNTGSGDAPASWDQACSRCQGAVGDGAGPGFNPMNNINHAIMAGCTLAVIEACQSDMYAQASTESLCMITNGVVGEFNWTSSADFNYARLNECAPHSAPLSRPAFPFSLAHAHTHSPKTHDPMHGRANVHLCAAGLRLSRR